MKINRLQLSEIRDLAARLETAPTEEARTEAWALYRIEFDRLARQGLPTSFILKAAGILPHTPPTEVQS